MMETYHSGSYYYPLRPLWEISESAFLLGLCERNWKLKQRRHFLWPERRRTCNRNNSSRMKLEQKCNLEIERVEERRRNLFIVHFVHKTHAEKRRYFPNDDIKLGFHKSEMLIKRDKNITRGLLQIETAIKHEAGRSSIYDIAEVRSVSSSDIYMTLKWGLRDMRRLSVSITCMTRLNPHRICCVTMTNKYEQNDNEVYIQGRLNYSFFMNFNMFFVDVQGFASGYDSVTVEKVKANHQMIPQS